MSGYTYEKDFDTDYFNKTFDDDYWNKAYSDYFNKTFETDYFTKGEYTPGESVKDALANLEWHRDNKNPGDYTSQWDTQIKEIMGNIMNRDKFTYDLNGDALYQQYKDKYIQQGKMAMGDAIGQASAMTGGYGNSYAQSVGQQAYQASLDNLNDIVPQLYQMALDKYNMEGQELKDQYGILSSQEAADYGKHRDKVADYQNMLNYFAGRYDSERAFDYGKYIDERDFAYDQYTADRTLAYDQYSSDRSLAYDQYSSDRGLAYDQYDSDRTLDYNEYRAGIADDQWQKEYDLQVAKSGVVTDETGKIVQPTETKNTTAFINRYSDKQRYLQAGHSEEEWNEYMESNIASFLRNDRITESEALYLIQYYGLS